MNVSFRCALTAVARGQAHADLYARGATLLNMMAADFLPPVSLTPRGVWDVKRARVLQPSRRR